MVSPNSKQEQTWTRTWSISKWEAQRHKNSPQSSTTHKGCLRLCCGAHKEPSLFQPYSTPNDHQDLVRFSLSNPHKGEGNTNFLKSTTTLVTLRQPNLSRGKISKSNERTEIISELLELKIEWVTQEWGSNLSWEARIRMKLGGEWLGAQESVSKCLQVENECPHAREAWGGGFYNP
jgi:hypothetical protein